MLMFSTSSPTCKDSCDGTFIALIDGGTGQLTVTWPELGITDPPAASGDVVQKSGLCSGIYTLNVVDENGCTDNAIEDVLEPPSMFSNVILTDAQCNNDCNGSAVSNGSGGNGGPFTYSWDNVPSSGGISNTNAVNGLCENFPYTLHIEDNQNCPYDTTFNTIDVTPVAVSITSTIDASCSYS